MNTEEKKLFIKKSTIPAAGKGLFTREFIAKGTRITEYNGAITTWKNAFHDNGRNLYICYVNRNHVIDASLYYETFARYANDASGLVNIKGFTNNCFNVEDGLRVFIQAKKDIAPGEEIFVGYGKGYWDTVRNNF